jgi:hypothetical protein
MVADGLNGMNDREYVELRASESGDDSGTERSTADLHKKAIKTGGDSNVVSRQRVNHLVGHRAASVDGRRRLGALAGECCGARCHSGKHGVMSRVPDDTRIPVGADNPRAQTFHLTHNCIIGPSRHEHVKTMVHGRSHD